jgi:ribosomal protein S27E
MATTRVLSVLTIRCVECGDAERLITVTPTALISRCYVCGDIQARARPGVGAEAPAAGATPAPGDTWPHRLGAMTA